MKKILLFVSCIGKMYCSSPNYSLTPAASLNDVAVYNALSIYDIYQVNTSSSAITLKWELVSKNIPSAWDFSLCDLGTCFPGIPASGTMDPVAVSDQGFLGLNINPYSTSGTAVVKIFVYENGFYSQGDTLTWTISSVASSIGENKNNIELKLFPNPSTDKITLSASSIQNEKLNYVIYSNSGQLIASGKFENGTTTIAVENFFAGNYYCYVFADNKRKAILKFTKPE
jgi:hypothetical protein